jgi:hypothetical protein
VRFAATFTWEVWCVSIARVLPPYTQCRWPWPGASFSAHSPGPTGFCGYEPTSVIQRPFCFWAWGPELRLWELGHWVPLFIFFSGLDMPLGAAGRVTPLEDIPSSSTPKEVSRGWHMTVVKNSKIVEKRVVKQQKSHQKFHYTELYFSIRIHVYLYIHMDIYIHIWDFKNIYKWAFKIIL